MARLMESSFKKNMFLYDLKGMFHCVTSVSIQHPTDFRVLEMRAF